MIVNKDVTVVDTGYVTKPSIDTLKKFLQTNKYKYSIFVDSWDSHKNTKRLVLGIEEGSMEVLLDWLDKIGIRESV